MLAVLVRHVLRIDDGVGSRLLRRLCWVRPVSPVTVDHDQTARRQLPEPEAVVLDLVEARSGDAASERLGERVVPAIVLLLLVGAGAAGIIDRGARGEPSARDVLDSAEFVVGFGSEVRCGSGGGGVAVGRLLSVLRERERET